MFSEVSRGCASGFRNCATHLHRLRACVMTIYSGKSFSVNNREATVRSNLSRGEAIPYGLKNGFPNVKKMLITLCYVYLWVRFQKCYTVVIRSTLHRLCGGSKTNASNVSFTFCALNPLGKPRLQKGQPTSLQSVNKQLSPPLPEEDVFLKLGDKAIYITEPQVTRLFDIAS